VSVFCPIAFAAWPKAKRVILPNKRRRTRTFRTFETYFFHYKNVTVSRYRLHCTGHGNKNEIINAKRTIPRSNKGPRTFSTLPNFENYFRRIRRRFDVARATECFTRRTLFRRIRDTQFYEYAPPPLNLWSSGPGVPF